MARKAKEEWIWSRDGNVCVRGSAIIGFRIKPPNLESLYVVIANLGAGQFQFLGKFDCNSAAIAYIEDCCNRINNLLLFQKVKEDKDV